MKLYIREKGTCRDLFKTTDTSVIPNVKDTVNIGGKEYRVHERVFTYNKVDGMDENECMLLVKEESW